MNRGLIGFLTFLAVLLFGLGVAAYLLGPNVLAFIFHAERRTEPVVIVDLLDFADAQHEQAYRQDFERPAAALIAALGGREIWKASAADVVRGQVLDGWPTLELVAYPSRAAFIELVTSGDYRALLDARDASVKRSAVLSARPAADFDTQGTQAQAVRFLAAAHDDSIDVYETKWLSEDDALLQRHQGKLIWRARLNPLVAESEQRFDEMLIYGFSDAEHRDDWASDSERETLQTLQRRLFRRDVLVLADTTVSADALVPADAAPSDTLTAPDAQPVAPEQTPQTGAGEVPGPEMPAGDTQNIDSDE
jgi:uncharacterized protein (DUF1330 family)